MPTDGEPQRAPVARRSGGATGAHTVSWLTSFAPGGANTALEPRAVKIGPDRYAVVFSVQTGDGYRTEYRLINSAGEVLASASFPDLLFCSISDPLLLDGKIYWVGFNPNLMWGTASEYLFALDVSNPLSPRLLGGYSSH